ncbi:MerR family DNA-binding transcriptional regulator [Halomicronema hongdechloris]
MTIRELADRTGVSIDTIRFYEKRGWLNAVHVQRQANNQPQPTSVP